MGWIGGRASEETTGLLAGRRKASAGPFFGAGFVGFRTLSGAAVATRLRLAVAVGRAPHRRAICSARVLNPTRLLVPLV